MLDRADALGPRDEAEHGCRAGVARARARVDAGVERNASGTSRADAALARKARFRSFAVLLDQLICPQQQRLRDRDAERLGRLEVDD